MRADEWTISAQVETQVNGERRVYEFTVDSSQADLFPQSTVEGSFDSEVERDFATRIDPLAEGWTVTREPTILRVNDRVMTPISASSEPARSSTLKSWAPGPPPMVPSTDDSPTTLENYIEPYVDPNLRELYDEGFQ